MSENASDRSPVTGLPRAGLPLHAVVVGDPDRAAWVAGHLDDQVLVSTRREYTAHRGRWQGTDLLVVSHGVGAPGALCAFEELLTGGVAVVVRLGTAGAVAPDLAAGSVVVATAAVRDDGVTEQYVPLAYPAYGDPALTLQLERSARRHGLVPRCGVVVTRALLNPGLVELPTAIYVQAGVLAIEMELAALLVAASTRGRRAGGILVVDGPGTEAGAYLPDPSAAQATMTAVLPAVLDAVVSTSVIDGEW